MKWNNLLLIGWLRVYGWNGRPAWGPATTNKNNNASFAINKKKRKKIYETTTESIDEYESITQTGTTIKTFVQFKANNTFRNDPIYTCISLPKLRKREGDTQKKRNIKRTEKKLPNLQCAINNIILHSVLKNSMDLKRSPVMYVRAVCKTSSENTHLAPMAAATATTTTKYERIL